MRSWSIQAKIAAAVVLCVVAIAAANGAVARWKFEQDMRSAAEQAVRTAGESFVRMERGEVEKLSTALDALAGQQAFASAFAARDRAQLLEAALPIFKELKGRHRITHWYFIDPDPARTCFLRVHRPELHDDVLNRQTLRAAIRTGETAAGKELGQTAFALRVVRPFLADGKLLGYMELGEELDDFLARLKAATGDDFALVVEKRWLDEKAWAATRGERRNGWNDDPEIVTVDATSPDAPVLGASADLRDLPDEGRFLAAFQRGSQRLARGVIPVKDAAGQRVGGLFILHDVTALHARAAADQLRVVLLIGAVAVAVLALLFVSFEVLVFRRLVRMAKAMEDVSVRLAGGDYDVGATIRPTAQDEIGRFEAFLAGFLQTIGSTLRELEKRVRRTG